ncbi:hypothetical protein Pla108_27090 [Botrimarina colliarenosi]|uniref:Uncharacterized protein n=2 Tax=Botrimarina TaxID=2795782 RepID=A0A5C5WGT8_9BACT|nr:MULTISPECIES: hypothetical protein [Botrimarina]TWT49002.1 hypothetical protein Pla111_07800 [Botrimarina hoheduenensis]TWT96933.1 hypothetical protein Pla108_27090 [Botrimarina colliarenosi]
MSRLPFPSNENHHTSVASATADKAPWKRVNPSEPPPMMFQVQLCDGRAVSYAYCDLREIRQRDAGYIELCLLGMEKTHVAVTGRNLTDLANLIAAGRIKSFEELGPRTFDRAESSPSIDKITIETLTGH